MPTLKKTPIWYYSPLLFFLLFVNKPFHIDDTLFINIGRILPWSFLGSSFGDISFLGKIYENLSPYESTHPPLIPYFMKVLGIGSLGRRVADVQTAALDAHELAGGELGGGFPPRVFQGRDAWFRAGCGQRGACGQGR